MQRLSLILLTWLSALTMSAEGFQYLTFETTEGVRISVPAESLTMTFSGASLKAGKETFTLENLKKMYFSTSDETTGISEKLRVNSEETATAIYDLQGHKVTKEQMRSGQVYQTMQIRKQSKSLNLFQVKTEVMGLLVILFTIS